MILLFGATGYTGRLVAQALADAGLPLCLAGRSPDALARLSAALPGAPAWRVADATQPATLPALFDGIRLVVNCAGPFTDLGEPLLARAALHGVHYLDTANELGYVYRVRSYDALARRNGAALVPACGFEVALADCAAATLAAEMAATAEAPLDEIDVVYDLRGRGSSYGSRRSAVRSLATSWLCYEAGQWQPAVPCRQVRRFPLPDGRRKALSFPSSEIATLPGHLAVRRVRTWLRASWHARYWAPVLLPLFAWLARGPLGRLVELASQQVLPPPAQGLRSEAPFVIRVQARRGDTSRALILAGRGVYELTARIVAYAAGCLARPDYDRAGVLAPAAALGPEALLARAAGWGVTLEREP